MQIIFKTKTTSLTLKLDWVIVMVLTAVPLI